MKLYYAKGACSLSIRILINELGLSCEYEAVNLKEYKTEKGEDFFKINPKGYVPTLITPNNQILTENIAIQIYLAQSQHSTELLPPPSDFGHYRVIEWLSFISSELHKTFGAIFHLQSDTIKNEVLIPKLKNRLTYINHEVATRNFLVDEKFTLSDAYLFVMLTWALKIKIDFNQFSNLSRYFDQLKSRPSIQKSIQEEGINEHFLY